MRRLLLTFAASALMGSVALAAPVQGPAQAPVQKGAAPVQAPTQKGAKMASAPRGLRYR